MNLDFKKMKVFSLTKENGRNCYSGDDCDCGDSCVSGCDADDGCNCNNSTCED
jgi:hypothetical protein